MRADISCLNLRSILIKPVQRIAQYPLLLGQLCKYTETDNQDYQVTILFFLSFICIIFNLIIVLKLKLVLFDLKLVLFYLKLVLFNLKIVLFNLGMTIPLSVRGNLESIATLKSLQISLYVHF